MTSVALSGSRTRNVTLNAPAPGWSASVNVVEIVVVSLLVVSTVVGLTCVAPATMTGGFNSITSSSSRLLA